MRLTFLVVLSAAICFLIGSDTQVDWTKFTWLVIGGFLVTGASNGINQIIEKDLDAKMARTKNRPMPTGAISVQEGLLLAVSMASLGIMILYFLMNPLSGILGALAVLLYTLAYTPFKRISPFCVFIGAFPGAIPTLLGYVAATGKIDITGLLLFGIQFIWQFPHFWAIAWVLDDDYKKAGFKMLPSNSKDKRSAFQILLYTFSLVPFSFLPYVFNCTNWLAPLGIFISGLIFSYQALNLYKHCKDEDARKLMFGSFIYLPVVQFSWLIDVLIF